MNKKKKDFLDIFMSKLGIVSDACKAAGISRETFYRWKTTDEEFAAACEEAKEKQLDFAESSLMRQIKENNPTATIFFLKCKGAGRGYVEKQTIEADVSLKTKPMTQEEAAAFLSSLEENL